MSASGGETRSSPSGWSVDTLKYFIEALLSEQDKRHEQRFIAQQQAVKDALSSAAIAVDKAETNAERWRANANEWRATMGDRERTFMPRLETEKQWKMLDDKINSITRLCVGAVVLGIAVITVVLLIVRH